MSHSEIIEILIEVLSKHAKTALFTLLDDASLRISAISLFLPDKRGRECFRRLEGVWDAFFSESNHSGIPFGIECKDEDPKAFSNWTQFQYGGRKFFGSIKVDGAEDDEKVCKVSLPLPFDVVIPEELHGMTTVDLLNKCTRTVVPLDLLKELAPPIWFEATSFFGSTGIDNTIVTMCVGYHAKFVAFHMTNPDVPHFCLTIEFTTKNRAE